MNNWLDFFYSFILGAALLLAVLGVWFTAIMPGLDRWNRRFFRSYFIILTACCVFATMEMALPLYPFPYAAFLILLYLECLFLSLPMPMLTVYLLHSCGDRLHESGLFRAALGMWATYDVLLLCSPFIGVFYFSSSNGLYFRGPLYPLLLVPLVVIMLLNLAGTIRRRKQLSRKTIISFLIAILPLTVTLLVQMFVDVFPLIDISMVLFSLSMFSLILSDQIEQDLMHQREIANQRASIMVLQMRPHFICNTLMSIYSLCNQDPQKARQVTKDFTDYLRRNFKAVASENTIPFSAELEHTRAYLAVEKAQHEEMLVVEYDTPFTRFRLPPLTLQPLVENAVKHGLNPHVGPLHVTIRTRHADSKSVIVVTDNGPGFNTADIKESYTTLTNIRQRLEWMCGGKMTIGPRDGGGTAVTVTIPDSAAE